MRRLATVVATVLLLPAAVAAQDRWTVADRAIRRLPPAAFPALPTSVRSALEARGCLVPQSSADPTPHNVIRGRFRRAGAGDWAVLCSIDRRSRILVFWAGRPDSVAELAEATDREYLQIVERGAIGFSRVVSVIRPAALRRRSAGPGPVPSPDHDGIEDAFLEKASTVWYFTGGRWLRWPGGD